MLLFPSRSSWPVMGLTLPSILRSKYLHKTKNICEWDKYVESLRVHYGVNSGFMYLPFVLSPLTSCLFDDDV
jgi:hypothetical protein